MRFPRKGRPARTRQNRSGRSFARPATFERLEDRRVLAVTATFNAVTGVVRFDGQAAVNDAVTIFVEAGKLKYTGATPDAATLDINVDSVTELVVDLGGGGDADSVEFGGALPVSLVNGQLEVTNTETVRIGQSLHAAGKLSITGGSIVIAAPAVTLSAGGDITLGGTIDGVAPPMPVMAAATAGPAPFSGGDFLAWQRSLGRSTGATRATGDMDGDGDVDRADLSAWRADFGDVPAAAATAGGGHTVGGQDFLAWQRSVGTKTGATLDDGDFDGDGDVDSDDLVFMQASFGNPMPASVLGTSILNIDADGAVLLQAAVGVDVSLASLTVEADDGITISGGIINLDGNSTTFNSAVVLAANLQIDDTGDVTFNSTVDGAFNLVVNTPTDTIFNGAVGDTTPLANLTVGIGSTAVGGQLIETTGDQSFAGAVELTNNATLIGQDVRFLSTVDGGFALTVTATGETAFAGAVGGGASLQSVTTDGGGVTLLGGNVTTVGDQLYDDAVQLTANVTLTGNDIEFVDTIDGAFALSVETTGLGTTTFGGAVGDTTPLVSLSTNIDGRTEIAGGTVEATGFVFLGDDIIDLTAAVTITSNLVNLIGDVNGAFTLTINLVGSGTVFLNGSIGDNTPLTSVTVNNAGSTFISGERVRTSGNQTYNQAVFLILDAIITSMTGNVTFDSTVDSTFAGPMSLLVNSPQTTTFGGRVGGSFALESLTTDADGQTNLNIAAAGIDVLTTGAQVFEDAVVLGAATELTGANVRFFKTVDGAFGLTVNTTPAGETEFRGAVGDGTPLASLTTNNLGVTLLGGLRVRTTGDQIYNDPVELRANATLTGDDIRFKSTVVGAFDLVVNAIGQIEFADDVNVRSVTTNPGGTALVGGDVTTTGDQTYRDAVQLTANATLAGNDVRFEQTVDGAFTLTVNTSGVGDTVFAGRVGDTTPLASLTTNGDGRTLIGGGLVETTGDQTYGDRVLLTTTNATLIGANVRLNNTLDGAFQLLVNTAPGGNTEFNGAVGDTTPLARLETDAEGFTIIRGQRIHTTGDQLYRDAVVLGNHATLRGDDVTFFQTVDSDALGPWDLIVDAVGAVGFGANVGVGRAVRDLVVDAGLEFTLNVRLVAARDVDIQVREAAAQTADEDIELLAAAVILAGRNVTLQAGDDVNFASGATINAVGTLGIDGDFGDNDPWATSILTANPSGTPTATGLLGGGAGITIRGGGDSTDYFRLQADRFSTPGTATVQGYLANPAASGADLFELFFSADFQLNIGGLAFDGGGAPGDGDRLTIDTSWDTTSRKLDVQYAATLPLASTVIDGSQAVLTGLGPAAITTAGIEKYFLNASVAPTANHDHLLIRGQDLTIPEAPQADPFFQLEQRILVSADGSGQWQIAGWDAGQLVGSNIRDVIENATNVPMLIEGGAGNDTLIGGGSVDVIFSGAGVTLTPSGQPRFFRVGAVDGEVIPASTVRAGDTLIGAGGNDFLFADTDLFREGSFLWGQLIEDVAGESDLLEGAGQGTSPLNQTNHGGQLGAFDIIRNITGMLLDGGGQKNVLTWLRAMPMALNQTPDLTSDTLNMLIDAAFRANDPVLGKVGLLSPPLNALFEDFEILEQEFPDDDDAMPVMADAAFDELGA